VEYSYEDVFPDTTNTPEQAMKVINAAKSIGLPTAMPEQITRGSEDFGWFLKQCPGAEFTVSAGDRPAIHTAAFDFMDELIGTMVDVYFAILAQ
jgi:metal-dependent amidase/aminoacylase/carboxypeptidase family protein